MRDIIQPSLNVLSKFTLVHVKKDLIPSHMALALGRHASEEIPILSPLKIFSMKRRSFGIYCIGLFPLWSECTEKANQSMTGWHGNNSHNGESQMTKYIMASIK